MKHIRTLMLAITCAASLVGAVYAAGMSSGSTASRLQPWLGTWSCTSKGGNYTSTFTPVLHGKAMRLTDNSPMPAEQVITWDSKRGKWIDQYVDASGAYATMEGTPSGSKMIVFKQVYPRSNALVTVTMPSNNKYTTQYAAMTNGKLMTNRDTCTRT